MKRKETVKLEPNQAYLVAELETFEFLAELCVYASEYYANNEEDKRVYLELRESILDWVEATLFYPDEAEDD